MRWDWSHFYPFFFHLQWTQTIFAMLIPNGYGTIWLAIRLYRFHFFLLLLSSFFVRRFMFHLQQEIMVCSFYSLTFFLRIRRNVNIEHEQWTTENRKNAKSFTHLQFAVVKSIFLMWITSSRKVFPLFLHHFSLLSVVSCWKWNIIVKMVRRDKISWLRIDLTEWELRRNLT